MVLDPHASPNPGTMVVHSHHTLPAKRAVVCPGRLDFLASLTIPVDDQFLNVDIVWKFAVLVPHSILNLFTPLPLAHLTRLLTRINKRLRFRPICLSQRYIDWLSCGQSRLIIYGNRAHRWIIERQEPRPLKVLLGAYHSNLIDIIQKPRILRVRLLILIPYPVCVNPISSVHQINDFLGDITWIVNKYQSKESKEV